MSEMLASTTLKGGGGGVATAGAGVFDLLCLVWLNDEENGMNKRSAMVRIRIGVDGRIACSN
jgi:hypothetical protein